jgi:hypothetical protein
MSAKALSHGAQMLPGPNHPLSKRSQHGGIDQVGDRPIYGRGVDFEGPIDFGLQVDGRGRVRWQGSPSLQRYQRLKV